MINTQKHKMEWRKPKGTWSLRWSSETETVTEAPAERTLVDTVLMQDEMNLRELGINPLVFVPFFTLFLLLLLLLLLMFWLFFIIYNQIRNLESLTGNQQVTTGKKNQPLQLLSVLHRLLRRHRPPPPLPPSADVIWWSDKAWISGTVHRKTWGDNTGENFLALMLLVYWVWLSDGSLSSLSLSSLFPFCLVFSLSISTSTISVLSLSLHC